MKYIIQPFSKIFNISEKATLKEFWIFFLFYVFLISPIIGFSRGLDFFGDNIALVLRIIFLIPFITLGIRRLNETKFNKWLFLIPIVNLILAAFPSETENN
jgi:uncharacterized membrane protein YhaH (DUF805 family)